MSENYSLNKLLTEYKINIPEIQRDYVQGSDYVQGRENIVRDAFLNTLFEFINSSNDNENLNLNLDYIYGYIDNEKNILYPIDGQQRLTTIWLLHLFFYSMLDSKESQEIDNFGNFSYAVRKLSKDFCSNLSETIKNNSLYNETKTPKEFLSNLNILDYETMQDKTVQSMVEMLNAMQEKYKKNEKIIHEKNINIIEKLNHINFKLINMNNLNLGENTYIKMNGRGKPLTPFENFKAWVMHDDTTKEIFSKEDYFEKIWIEYFWRLVGDESKFDNVIMTFTHYCGLYFLYGSKWKKDNKTYDFKLEQANEGKYLNINTEILDKSLYVINEKSVFTCDNLLIMTMVIKYLLLEDKVKDKYPTSENQSFIISLSENKNKEKEDNILRLFSLLVYAEAIFKNKTIDDMIKYYKDFEEHKKQEKENNKDTDYDFIDYYNGFINNNIKEFFNFNFNDWYGFCERIIVNNRSGSYSYVNNMTNNIFKKYQQYITNDNGFMKTLFNNKDKEINDNFIDSQNEEILKATLIQRYREDNDLPNWEEAINEAHKNQFFKGKIKFLLDYSKISENINQDNIIEEYNIDNFNKYYKTIAQLFSGEIYENKEHLLVRFLLCHFKYDLFPQKNKYKQTFLLYANQSAERHLWYNLLNAKYEDNKYKMVPVLDELYKQVISENIDIIKYIQLKINDFDYNSLQKEDYWRLILIKYGNNFDITKKIYYFDYNPSYFILNNNNKYTYRAKNLLLFGFYYYLKETKNDWNIDDYFDTNSETYKFKNESLMIYGASHRCNNIEIWHDNEKLGHFEFNNNTPLFDFYNDIINCIEDNSKCNNKEN